ncbi:death domain-containing protein CRADD [Menidia menidia]
MEPVHRDLLRGLRLELADQLLVSEAVVPFLYQEEILTEAQVEDIESQPSNRRKCLRLLDLLPHRGPRAFDAFIRALEDFSWVRDRLLLELQAGGESPQAGDTPPERLTLPGPPLTPLTPPPPPDLHRVPSDRQLSRLAGLLGSDWPEVLLDLGLPAEALDRCRADHALSSRDAAMAALVQWRRARGGGATAARLLGGLQAAGLHPSVLQDAMGGGAR